MTPSAKRHRYYAPSIGQFVSRDPLETANRYAYVGGNVVNATDPSGLVAASPRALRDRGDGGGLPVATQVAMIRAAAANGPSAPTPTNGGCARGYSRVGIHCIENFAVQTSSGTPPVSVPSTTQHGSNNSSPITITTTPADDPNITSSGGFGASQNQPANDPNITSSGGFGAPQSSSQTNSNHSLGSDCSCYAPLSFGRVMCESFYHQGSRNPHRCQPGSTDGSTFTTVENPPLYSSAAEACAARQRVGLTCLTIGERIIVGAMNTFTQNFVNSDWSQDIRAGRWGDALSGMSSQTAQVSMIFSVLGFVTMPIFAPAGIIFLSLASGVGTASSLIGVTSGATYLAEGQYQEAMEEAIGAGVSISGGLITATGSATAVQFTSDMAEGFGINWLIRNNEELTAVYRESEHLGNFLGNALALFFGAQTDR